jgi:hypothetical protein
MKAIPYVCPLCVPDHPPLSVPSPSLIVQAAPQSSSLLLGANLICDLNIHRNAIFPCGPMMVSPWLISSSATPRGLSLLSHQAARSCSSPTSSALCSVQQPADDSHEEVSMTHRSHELTSHNRTTVRRVGRKSSSNRTLQIERFKGFC